MHADSLARFPPQRALPHDRVESPRDPDFYDGEMRISPILNIVLKALGPALLGFGTIFQPKANPTDHWSTSPQVVIRVDVSQDESRERPLLDRDLTTDAGSIAA